jgi:uncharacterized glyoxalase superfamily protein PhnB
MANVSPIPAGFHTVTTSLILKDAHRALDFYARAFRARERMRLAAPDGKIAHAELQIGDSVVMLSEAAREAPTSANVFLYVPDVDAVVARAAAAGGEVTMPPADMFWGDRFGRVVDPFGVRWDVATHVEDVPPEEIPARMAKMGAPA